MTLEPKHPETLSPESYHEGLEDRITEVLLPALQPYFSLPSTKNVLELAAGYGKHAAIYAQQYPDIIFSPTEVDSFGIDKIEEMRSKIQLENVRPAQLLDVTDEETWDSLQGQYDLVIGSNFFHMVPLPQGHRAIFNQLKTRISPHHGRLLVYGPFREDGGYFSTADEKFDAMIRSRPNGDRLGLRSIEELGRIAQGEGWFLENKIPMPKNNFILVFAPEGVQPLHPEPPLVIA